MRVVDAREKEITVIVPKGSVYVVDIKPEEMYEINKFIQELRSK